MPAIQERKQELQPQMFMSLIGLVLQMHRYLTGFTLLTNRVTHMDILILDRKMEFF